ncbi:restriction endonuclease subunit S [Micromonospora halotolerans]|uniref:Restriction endonuclease subunit S n=1 Tax=Micromonospora halotolerans TaxID=709879 RepID=A0ABY9ZV31_9ACTN|nr:restriction endonuclease subunit S [Micromonospora halotolerans]WNM39151.1 restriction endonuclease subunit S [Micromonospora halotolerans]
MSEIAPWLVNSRYETVPIRYVAKLGTGHTPSRQKPEYWQNCDIPWITLADVWQLRDQSADLIQDTKEKVSALGLAHSAAVKHPAGTVILSRTASVGFSAIMGKDMATSQDFATWTCGHGLHPKFLLYVLKAMAPDLRRVAAGSTHKTIYMPDIEQLRTPLPPLIEQRRIVDFLDRQTIRFRRVVERRQRQLILLSERRRSMLPLMVSGAHLSATPVETNVPWYPALHSEGQIVPLLRAVQLQRGIDLTAEQRRPGNVVVVTTAGVVGEHDVAIVKGPGVVVGRYGSAGAVHWVGRDFWPHNTTLYVRDFKGNDPRFCYYLLKSLPFEMEQARSAIPGLNRNDLHKREVPLLPLELQRQVAHELDDAFGQLERSEELVRQSLALLTERYHAVVTAAVCGQLDASTAEGADV